MLVDLIPRLTVISTFTNWSELIKNNSITINCPFSQFFCLFLEGEGEKMTVPMETFETRVRETFVCMQFCGSPQNLWLNLTSLFYYFAFSSLFLILDYLIFLLFFFFTHILIFSFYRCRFRLNLLVLFYLLTSAFLSFFFFRA